MAKKAVSLDEVKTINLEIMLDIDRVCRKYNIKYTIIGGTLIGAVRHKGFIPWDDDIDIAILRPDYEKFLEVYEKEKNGRYELFENRTQSDYYYLYAKVVDKRTELIENNLKPIRGMGVCVDIFPLDNVNSKRAEAKNRKLQFYKKGLAKNIFDIEKTSKNKLRLFLKKLVYPMDFQYYFDKISCLMQSENNRETDAVAIQGDMFPNLFILPVEVYQEYTDLTFEGKKLMVVKDYKMFLEKRFGDYMKLPPKEERHAHPREAYWKETDGKK